MKFTDGNWMMRPGVVPHFAAQVFGCEDNDQGLKLEVPTHQIRHRGDTLQGPNLTVRLSSPMPDVIRIRISHFEGVQDSGPHFEIQAGPAEFEYGGEDSPPEEFTQRRKERKEHSGQNAGICFHSGNLVAQISKETYGLRFVADGKELTSAKPISTAYMEVGEDRYLVEALNLAVGENVYGLGERFTAFVKNGQTVDMWNEDGGTNSEQAYKNIPFYLTNRGYGVFVNHTGRVSFEVASERVSRVQFSVPGESLEYFVIYGPTPKEILKKYTALTGRPALPPAWSFGLWLSTSFTTDYDEETVTGFIEKMASYDIPLSVFHFDCFWMRAFRWTDLVWDPEVFPDPEGMLKRLKERGVRICVWINPYVAQASRLFEVGKKHGYFLKRQNGDIWQWDMWQPGMAIIDFTNPKACEWFRSHLEKLLDMGVDAFKTDFGERIPTDVVYAGGQDAVRMHNYYTLLYNECAFETLRGKRGNGDAVVFARSATAGSQKYPVHWGGDCHSDFESMAESLRGGLSLGLCGFGFWSHDIGGFEGNPDPALYKRWVAFGLLSSHSRLHGSTSYRAPWLFDEEAVEVLRFFTKLKCSLMPYLFAKAIEAHERGIPLMRPMMMEFPSDPTCQMLDRQYMLGDSLLVAPVMSFEGEVEFYVPAGRWTSLIDGSAIEGPKWVREKHSFMSLPVLVRPNTVLARGAVDSRPDYDYGEGPIFEIYALEDGAKVHCPVPRLDGTIAGRLLVRRAGDEIEVDVEGDIRDWKLLLVNVRKVEGEGFAQYPNDRGTLIVPRGNLSKLKVVLGK